MATVDLETVARLIALESGRAAPLASHLQIAIRSDALVLCCFAMAGEATTVHIAACGRLGQPAEFMSVPDPRFRDEQYELLAWIGTRVERYYSECRERGTFPQIWVASEGAIKHLDLLADRLRFHQDNPASRRLGELLTYATERHPIDGQQALFSATSALSRHYATGQQAAEDEHLGALLTWIDPPADVNVLAAVAVVERVPMGAKTDPEFDRLILEPLVGQHNAARRSGATVATLKRRAERIHDALLPVVSSVYEATQTALTILQTRWPQRLPGLDDLQRREAAEFASFMESRDGGFPIPLRDRPKAAAFKLTEREDARKTFEAALRMDDKVALAKALLTGRVVEGTVENPRQIRLQPRKFLCTFDLISKQRILRVRPGDEFRLLSDPRLVVIVRSVQRRARTSRLELEITKGARAVGLPVSASIVILTPSVPDWDSLVRSRLQLKDRLAIQPWTHVGDTMPPSIPSQMVRPNDLLASVEALR
jgi:hypothetical protein